MLTFEGPIDITLFVIQVLACVSFGTSGAFTAIRKKLDILGLLVLTFIATFGGGMLRDVFIGQEVPHALWDPQFFILEAVTLGTALFWFFIAYFPKTAGYIEKHRHDAWIVIVDAIGISAFTVAGCRTGFNHLSALPSDYNGFAEFLYCSSLGVLTGVGGGVIRDALLGQIPLAFRKQFYITPCIIGGMMFTLCRMWGWNEYVNVFLWFVVIVVLRALAFRFNWNLPSAKGYNSIVDKEEITFQRKVEDDD